MKLRIAFNSFYKHLTPFIKRDNHARPVKLLLKELGLIKVVYFYALIINYKNTITF